MNAEWTEFFYGKHPPLSPPLDATNWCRWNSSILHLLTPYKEAMDVLRGRSDDGCMHQIDRTTIDSELFLLLLKSLDRSIRPIAMDTRARHGLSGSKLYGILKAHYGTEDVSACMLKVEARSSIASSATSSVTLGSVSTTPARKRKISTIDAVVIPKIENTGVKKEPAELDVDAKDHFQQATKKAERYSDKRRRPNADFRLTLAPTEMIGCPKLSTDNWPHWDGKLRRVLSYADETLVADKILRGIITECHPSYRTKTDAELFRILEAAHVKGHYAQIVDRALGKHGRKGSRVYAALKVQIQAEKKEQIRLEFGNAKSSLRHCLLKLRKLLKVTSQDYDIVFSDKEVEQYVKEIGYRFTEKIIRQKLMEAECTTLYEYYKKI